MIRRNPVLIVCLAAMAALWLLHAQVGPDTNPRFPLSAYGQQGDYGPILVPTGGTAICTASLGAACSSTRTVYVTQITLSDESGSGDTCYVVDQQGTNRAIVGVSGHAVSITGTQIYTFQDRKAPGGVKWACTGGTVTGYIRYEY